MHTDESGRSREPSSTGTGAGQRAASDRGQTTLDFAVGMSVFLLVVAFVFAFTPGFLEPFTSGPVEETVGVNRVADELAMDLLGTPDDPFVLDEGCTAAFFDGESPSRCAFTGASLAERVGVSPRQHVNVTVWGNVSGPDGRSVLCYFESNRTVMEKSRSSCSGVWLGAGSNSVGAQETVTARRVVTLADERVTLEVEMW